MASLLDVVTACRHVAPFFLAVIAAHAAATTEEEALCQHDMPADWLARCREGQLLFSPSNDGGFLPEVGNGFLATVVSSDVIYSAGFFNGPSLNKCPQPSAWCGTGSHRAAIPPYKVSLADALQPIAGWGGRVLDVEQGVFTMRGVIHGGKVRVEERWYAPLQEPSLLVHEVELQNTGSETEVVRFTGSGAEDGGADLDARAAQILEGTRGLVGENRIPEVEGSDHTRFALAATLAPESVNVPANGSTVMRALTAITTSLNSTDPQATVEALLSNYIADGFAKAQHLLAEHSALWRQRAEMGRLEVEGDLTLAQAVNASLYFIRSSVREDWPHGISPGGLASNAYNGHTFWDQETWMYPPVLMLEPGLARSMLQYRADRMKPAREKARKCSKADDNFMKMWSTFQVHGAMKPAFWTANPYTIQDAYCEDGYDPADEALMFPWESAATGVETNYMDQKLGPWAMFEQHLDGDIALAARQYWYITGDREWLKAVGFPIANGTASFYNARVVPRPGTDGKSYDFAVVMGPDEYGFPVKNSAYTNAVARIALEFAADAARELHYTGGIYDTYREKAEGIFMPLADEVPGRSDLKGGYHPEYEGFPAGSSGEAFYLPSPGCNEPGGCVKQADTILLNYPLGVKSHSTVLANDLSFYEGVTDPNGPAMTWAMFAINWLDVGNYDKSAAMFSKGYGNVRPPFNVWTEYPRTYKDTGAVNFITGAGGFLQSVIFGALGIRIGPNSLSIDPPPPSATGTSASRFAAHSFHYLGARLRHEVSDGHIRVELLQESPHVTLCVKRQHHDEQRLDTQRPVGIPRSRAEIRVCAAADHHEIEDARRQSESASFAEKSDNTWHLPNLPFLQSFTNKSGVEMRPELDKPREQDILL